jgi:hypothetical protein
MWRSTREEKRCTLRGEGKRRQHSSSSLTELAPIATSLHELSASYDRQRDLEPVCMSASLLQRPQRPASRAQRGWCAGCARVGMGSHRLGVQVRREAGERARARRQREERREREEENSRGKNVLTFLCAACHRHEWVFFSLILLAAVSDRSGPRATRGSFRL